MRHWPAFFVQLSIEEACHGDLLDGCPRKCHAGTVKFLTPTHSSRPAGRRPPIDSRACRFQPDATPKDNAVDYSKTALSPPPHAAGSRCYRGGNPFPRPLSSAPSASAPARAPGADVPDGSRVNVESRTRTLPPAVLGECKHRIPHMLRGSGARIGRARWRFAMCAARRCREASSSPLISAPPPCTLRRQCPCSPFDDTDSFRACYQGHPAARRARGLLRSR